MPRSLAGSRIREVRRRLGLSQTELARQAGISASYLNLIEHNKRGIGGKILNTIADLLSVRPSELSDGRHPSIVADLHEAALRHNGPTAPPEDFAARFPDWAQFLSVMDRRIRDQDAVISALSDRLTHDPFLAESVHAMLSNTTAIRATASLLSEVNDIPRAQTDAFHNSLHAESMRLSETAQGLAQYLSRSGSAQNAAATAEEVVDQWLVRNAFHFEVLDTEADSLSHLSSHEATHHLSGLIDDLLAGDGDLVGSAEPLARQHLIRYAEDATSMPLKAFYDAAKRADYDPVQLSGRFAQPVHAVFRRLAVLRRPWIEAPQFGLITVNASGMPLIRQPLPGFALPRHGSACSLWPLFRAFTQPNQPLLSTIEHDTGSRFVALSLANPREAEKFGAATDMLSAMLFVPEDQSPYPQPTISIGKVGTTCAICTNAACGARITPQLLA